MPCLAAPKIPPPPGLDDLLPALSFSAPQVGVRFCCTFETPPVPGSPFILPLGLIPGVATILNPLTIAVIMRAIDTLNAMLDELQFSCPLE